MSKIIGRKVEISILSNALASDKPKLIAVYGRRRVGKTFLIRNMFNNDIIFEISGIYNVTLKKQLNNFYLTLNKKYSFKKPSGWIEAFHHLGQYIDTFKSKKKKVIFVDEFPWLDTPKSGFLPAFDNFWNSYASKRNDLVVIICGSAASYMIKNIIRSKGGLHNRLTDKIQLLPFNLHETELLLKHNKIDFTRYDILQIYMAMGGVPHYLEKLIPGESVTQSIDRLCFSKDGFLRNEFSEVFASLFNHHENHSTLIRSLAKVRKGLTRNEIMQKSKISSGGTLTKTLQELEESGFIEKYTSYLGKKDSVYRLSDEYSLFYIKFIEDSKPSSSGVWSKLYNQPPFKIWAGFSFETICIKHIDQIKEGLKIAGINAIHGSWLEKNTQNSAQIDLLIDRADNVINICEMKFYNAPFTLDQKYGLEITNKKNAFTNSTGTKKNVYITFITTYGLVNNKYKNQFVTNELTMDHLFIDA